MPLSPCDANPSSPASGYTSYRDPENAAVGVDGRWYRVAGPSSAAALRRLRDSEVYTRRVADGSLVRFDEVHENEATAARDAYRDQTGRTMADRFGS